MAIEHVTLDYTIDEGRLQWNNNDAELDVRLAVAELAIQNIPNGWDPPAFFAQRTGQAIVRLGAGVATKITFPTAVYDSHGRYNAGSSIYTCPADPEATSDGRSMWIAMARFTLNDMGALNTYTGYIFKDGNPTPGGNSRFRAATGNSGMSLEVWAPFYKENNQTPAIEVYCLPQAAVDVDGNNGSFTIWRVR